MVRPEHWDGHQVKVQAGTPHASVNPRLNRAAEAAAETQQLATKQGRKLPKAELKAAVEAALALTLAAVQAPPEAPAFDFEALQTRWITEHRRRPRTGSGKPLTKLAIAGLMATKQRFQQYAQAPG